MVGRKSIANVCGACVCGLIFNYDETEFFGKNAPAPMNGRALDERLDELIEQTGAAQFMCNINAQRANYDSAVLEPYWKGYDPEAGDGQPFLAGLKPDERPAYRRLCGNMLALHQEGVDYAARVIRRCRRHGVSPWISLRMNDVHDNDRVDHPSHSTFWRTNAAYWRVPDRQIGYFDRALDYSQKAVRDLYLALVQEALDRYDSDGLELDFMRAPFLFRPGHEGEGGKLLTEWLGEVRRRTAAAGRQRGRPVRLAVRVPANPLTACRLGLDAALWAQQGLVDLVTVAPWFESMDGDPPFFLWKKLLAPYPVTLAAGLEMNMGGGVVDPETAVGAALVALHGGADCLYVFNYYPTSWCKDWPAGKYEATLRAMSSIEALERLGRCHKVARQDLFAPGETEGRPLPATGTRLFFRLATGPRPAGKSGTLVLATTPPDGAGLRAPDLRVNGAVCALRPNADGSPPRMGMDGVCVYTVPEVVFVDAVQLIEVFSPKPLTVTRIALYI